MRERGYCYPYPVGRMDTKIVESGPLGTTVRMHDRPDYTLDEARLVCRWVNGFDQPLETMKERKYDIWDPLYRHHAGWGWPQRQGLAPLPDKK